MQTGGEGAVRMGLNAQWGSNGKYLKEIGKIGGVRVGKMGGKRSAIRQNGRSGRMRADP